MEVSAGGHLIGHLIYFLHFCWTFSNGSALYFLPHALAGILPHSNHPQYSYHNNVTMNLPHASFIAPTTMPTQSQILNQHFPTTSHPAFPTSMGPLPAARPVPKHSSHYNAAPPIIPTPPTITPPSTNNTTNKFYPKDALLEFFAEGQSKSLHASCSSAADRMKFSRVISGIPTLYQIWKRQDTKTGFYTSADS